MARLLPPAESLKLIPLAEIARGGMGSVELARAEGGRLGGQLLAIKRLHPNIAADPQFVGMFLDEAWITAAIDNPHVVRVAAWGNDAKGMFLAVEFVRGISLARLMKETQQNKEPFAERTIAFIASQICGALAAAHGLKSDKGEPMGLVHRDLTPGNILIAFDGTVKIVDFGIAKAEERITHTRTGTLKGKPAYMSPEQTRTSKIDHRADIFSLGVVLFELLTGRRPWTAASAFDVMLEVSTKPPPDITTLRKNMSPVFPEIVNKCLEKDPAKRFQSAQEIKDKLDAWRRSKGFENDDAQSLAQYAVRNSQAQIKWFDEALRGEMAQRAGLSFKELEEKIDAERESLREGAGSAMGGPRSPQSPQRSQLPRQPLPGPAMQSATIEPPTIVNPMQQQMRSPTPFPPQQGSHYPQAVIRPSGAPQAQVEMSAHSAMTAPTARPSTQPSATPMGTQYMVATPADAYPPVPGIGGAATERGGIPAAYQQTMKSPPGLEPPPRRSGVAAPPSGPRAPELPLPPDSKRGYQHVASTTPMDHPPQGTTRPKLELMQQLQATVNDPAMGRRPYAQPVAPPVSSKKGSSALPIVLVLLVLLIGGAAFAAWRYHVMESTTSGAPPPG